jgi:hypothetical protein
MYTLVRVTVADDDGLDLGWIETERLEPRQEERVDLIGA